MLPNSTFPVVPAGTETESAFGSAFETGDDEATTEMSADPIAAHGAKAAVVPAVCCWNARF